MSSKMQKALDDIKKAGVQLVGEEIKPEFHGEKRSRAELEAEYNARIRRLERRQARWHGLHVKEKKRRLRNE